MNPSETDDNAKQKPQLGRRELGQVADLKVVVGPGNELVAVAEQVFDLALGTQRLVRRRRADEDGATDVVA